MIRLLLARLLHPHRAVARAEMVARIEGSVRVPRQRAGS